MTNNRKLSTLTTIFIITLLTACGGGGGGGGNNSDSDRGGTTTPTRFTDDLEVRQSDIDLVNTDLQDRYNEVIAITSTKDLSEDSLTGLWIQLEGSVSLIIYDNDKPYYQVMNTRRLSESFVRVSQDTGAIILATTNSFSPLNYEVVERDGKTYLKNLSSRSSEDLEISIEENRVITLISSIQNESDTNSDSHRSYMRMTKWVKVSNDEEEAIGIYTSDLTTSDVDIDHLISSYTIEEFFWEGNHGINTHNGIVAEFEGQQFRSDRRVSTENGKTTHVSGTEITISGFRYYFVDEFSGANAEVILTPLQ
ncbi:hypothetical protein [Ketobacter sp.]|uniref:hypothetical protein n=1 Tax=Ketobacter sp. TaxID=2083498 RepID=UPI000F2CB653|nr:hypothetical protein [Ketobacter sp.]RLT99232.1 MAG: hypothetical protein D9N14_08795 [Ketobacter sp.]